MAADKGDHGGVLSFLKHEAAGGLILMAAALLAMLMDNSSLTALYDAFLDTPVTVKIGKLGVDKPLLLWINDGLMAIFFCLVALEIKREMIAGELSSFDKALLPAIAAVGGMAIPALIYAGLNMHNPAALRGWAIPSATDIAFAVAVLALVGPKVPASLKIFLLALAIIDDLGAIIIIALFYTDELAPMALGFAGIGALILFALNRRGVAKLAPYVLVGILMWVCVLKSGIHATLAGVLVGLSIPMRDPANAGRSPLAILEHGLHPWVAFAILPLFGFANAGISLAGLSFASLMQPIPLGIAAGLFFGKQIGVFGATWAAVKLGACSKPDGATWMQIWGLSALAGIGFTMSLFIGTLAFPDPAHAVALRLGVLAGSLASALLGYFILRTSAGVVAQPR